MSTTISSPREAWKVKREKALGVARCKPTRDRPREGSGEAPPSAASARNDTVEVERAGVVVVLHVGAALDGALDTEEHLLAAALHLDHKRVQEVDRLWRREGVVVAREALGEHLHLDVGEVGPAARLALLFLSKCLPYGVTPSGKKMRDSSPGGAVQHSMLPVADGFHTNLINFRFENSFDEYIYIYLLFIF